MAGSVLGRSPTCLACLRRLATGTSSGARAATTPKLPTVPTTVSLMQTRGKSNHMRPQDQGVVVRLLEDIPKFGRKDLLLRVDRGRMRNHWYPRKQAEYMTPARFHELGLTPEDIGERDHVFHAYDIADSELGREKDNGKKNTVEVVNVPPDQASRYMSVLVPDKLVFYAKLIHQTTAPAAAAGSSSPASESGAKSEPAKAQEHDNRLAIYGSVSTRDIVHDIQRLLSVDKEASRVILEPENVRILGVEDGADRVKMVGQWQIRIVLGKGYTLTRTIEVVPEQEKPAETHNEAEMEESVQPEQEQVERQEEELLKA